MAEAFSALVGGLREGSDPVFHRFPARLLETRDQHGPALRERRFVGASDDEIGADPAFAEEGIGADLAAFDAPPRPRAADRRPRSPRTQQPIVREMSGRPPSSVPAQRLEHQGGDVGHAGEDEDVADRMPGAPDILFSISSAPAGTRAMRSRASVTPPRSRNRPPAPPAPWDGRRPPLRAPRRSRRP